MRERIDPYSTRREERELRNLPPMRYARISVTRNGASVLEFAINQLNEAGEYRPAHTITTNVMYVGGEEITLPDPVPIQEV